MTLILIPDSMNPLPRLAIPTWIECRRNFDELHNILKFYWHLRKRFNFGFVVSELRLPISISLCFILARSEPSLSFLSSSTLLKLIYALNCSLSSLMTASPPKQTFNTGNKGRTVSCIIWVHLQVLNEETGHGAL